MALKDWRKVDEGSVAIIFHKMGTEEDLLILKPILPVDLGYYKVNIHKGDRLLQRKRFRSKQKALRFAKAYMRIQHDKEKLKKVM